ncbi:MAG TPA: hypothetical protein V6D28_06645 [Leptolyngbyaceae cyanobacterium]
MKVLHQSASVKDAFQNQVNQKKATNRQATQESLGGGFFGVIGAAMFDFKQVKNQFKGSVGEWGISLLLKSLPDTWVMFNNAKVYRKLGDRINAFQPLVGDLHCFFSPI